jgi:PEP-CTERM motif
MVRTLHLVLATVKLGISVNRKVVAALVLIVLYSNNASAVIIGGFDGSRVLSGVYSIFEGSANAELNNAANFPLYGDSVTFSASTTFADDAYLSGIDIFFTGLLNFDTAQLSGAEITSLTNFINGGGVVIAHGDNTGFDQTVDGLLNAFGLDIINTSNNSATTTVNILNGSHAVTNGPFGVVNDHAISDSARLGAASGDAQILGQYSDGFGAIGIVDPNGTTRLGGLLFLPDSESYGLTNSNFRNLADTKTLFNNSIAWGVNIANASVPTPSTLLLFGFGIAGLFATRRGRSKVPE